MKSFTLIITLLLLSSESYCQNKNKLAISSGYIADIVQFIDPGYGDKPEGILDNPKVYGKIFNGYSIKGSYQRKLSTGYWMAIEAQMANISYNYNDPCQIYWDEKESDNYILINFSFSKNILKKSNLHIYPKIGLLYRHLTLNDIDYDITADINYIQINSVPMIYNNVFNDFGTSIGIEFSYIFNNNFFVGLNLQVNYIFDIGLETCELSPTIGVNF